MRVLYFTGAYRPDSMVSHTHGELVAALRARGVAMEIATIGARDQATAIARETDTYGTVVWRIRPASGALARIRRAYSARVWAFPPFADVVARPARVSHPGAACRRMTSCMSAWHSRTRPPSAMHSRVATAPPVIVIITGGDILTDDATGYGYGRLPTTRRAIQRTLRWATLVQANSPRSARDRATIRRPPGRIAVQPPQSAHEAIPDGRCRDVPARSACDVGGCRRAATGANTAWASGAWCRSKGSMMPSARSRPSCEHTRIRAWSSPARRAMRQRRAYVASLEALAAAPRRARSRPFPRPDRLHRRATLLRGLVTRTDTVVD